MNRSGNRSIHLAHRRLSLLLGALLFAIFSTGCSELPSIVIAAPTHGAFTQAATVDVIGAVTDIDPAVAELEINGVVVPVEPNGTFSHTVTLDPAVVFNSIDVSVTDAANGYHAASRVVVIAGDSIADGAYSQESVALRINDSGLDTLEASVADLVEFDPATLIPIGTVVLDECVAWLIWCVGSAKVTVVNPPPTVSSFGIVMDSMTNFVAADVLIEDLDMDLYIDGTGVVPNCGLGISAATTNIFGDYALDPGVDPTTVDVNQLAGVSVVFSNFNDDLGGICDFPIIGDIIQLFLPDIEDLFHDGFVEFLDDPDGVGPQDAAIADAIEDALLGIEITGPIGESLGVALETPIFDIPEDTDGLTIGSDASATATIGTGPGECDAPAGVPDLLASYHVTEAFPALGATTPAGTPYEIGIALSTSAFNQLLKAQIECGLLRLELDELDVGFGPLPLTAGLLALLIPEFSVFPGTAPIQIVLRPTLAPVLTGNAGPAGELGELRIGQLIVELRDPTPGVETPLLVAAVDFRAGFELLVDDATGQLAPSVTSLAVEDITVSIVDNLVQTDEATLQTSLPDLLTIALPALGTSLGSFPVPTFLDFQLDPVEISKSGQFMTIFSNLVIPLLGNGTMEDTLDGPADATDWEGDQFTIVGVDGTVTPLEGASMLRFDATGPAGATATPDAEIQQEVDLAASASLIASGRAVFQTTAFFNRVDAGPNTDTEFQIALDALDGGGAVLASAQQSFSSDGDDGFWQEHLTALVLPAGTAKARVTLVATEDVLDDAVAPEFDGHYADNARAHVLPPLVLANADMEDGGDVFDDGVAWEQDGFAIVSAENGITPQSGASMLRFDTSDGANPSAQLVLTVTQPVDLTEYAKLIGTGAATFDASAWVNRVAGDAETDTQFSIVLLARDAGGLIVGSVFAPYFSDADPGTWEQHQTSLLLDPTSTSVDVLLSVVENTFNDLVAPELDGHYMDGVAVSITP